MKSYETLEEIRELLLSNGFHEYKPTPFDNESIRTCFQKRYDDEIGKKYFLDCKVWDWTWNNQIPEKYHPEFCGQMYQKGTHDAIDYTFISWDLDQAEKFLEDWFQSGLLEHYEIWD